MKDAWWMGWAALALAATCVFAADDVIVERVIGSEYPGAYKHPCTVTQLDNGDLY